MDHLALEVASRDALQAWISHLEQVGVAYSPIKELGHASFICIKDPDDIPIELWHALSLVPAQKARAYTQVGDGISMAGVLV